MKTSKWLVGLGLISLLVAAQVNAKWDGGESCSDHARPTKPQLSAKPEQSSTPQPSTNSNEELKPGSKLDHWELVEPLAQGGFGAVWKAKGHLDGKMTEVAIKVANPTAVARERLREERSINIRLGQPSRVEENKIIPMYAGDLDHNPPYLVFRLIKGSSLRRIIEEKRYLSIKTILSITDNILEALEHAHLNNVIHRDVKPENVLVEDGSSTAWSADFGISTRTDESKDAQDGVKISLATVVSTDGNKEIYITPGYTAPEIKAGSEPNASSDIFSVGVLFKELYVSCLRNDGAALSVNGLVSSFLDRATSKDRAHRYSSASDARGAIAKIVHALDAPEQTPKIARSRTSSKWPYFALGAAIFSGWLVHEDVGHFWDIHVSQKDISRKVDDAMPVVFNGSKGSNPGVLAFFNENKHNLTLDEMDYIAWKIFGDDDLTDSIVLEGATLHSEVSPNKMRLFLGRIQKQSTYEKAIAAYISENVKPGRNHYWSDDALFEIIDGVEDEVLKETLIAKVKGRIRVESPNKNND
ncbi:MAG: serine/threonine-protein kinase [Bacteriovoracia bacterium]